MEKKLRRSFKEGKREGRRGDVRLSHERGHSRRSPGKSWVRLRRRKRASISARERRRYLASIITHWERTGNAKEGKRVQRHG